MPTSGQTTHHAVVPYTGAMPSTLSQHPAVQSQATALHPSGPNHYIQMTKNEMHVHGVDGQTIAAVAAAAGSALGASQAQTQAAVAERDRIAQEAHMKKEWDERTIREREAALHQQQIWNASVSAQHQSLQQEHARVQAVATSEVAKLSGEVSEKDAVIQQHQQELAETKRIAEGVYQENLRLQQQQQATAEASAKHKEELEVQMALREKAIVEE